MCANSEYIGCQDAAGKWDSSALKPAISQRIIVRVGRARAIQNRGGVGIVRRENHALSGLWRDPEQR